MQFIPLQHKIMVLIIIFKSPFFFLILFFYFYKNKKGKGYIYNQKKKRIKGQDNRIVNIEIYSRKKELNLYYTVMSGMF